MKTTSIGFLLLLSIMVVTESSVETPAATEDSVSTITVDAKQVIGPVNSLIFGQNVNAADNARIFSSDTTDLNLIQRGTGMWDPLKRSIVPEVLNESRAAGMTLLRYPGGCLAHNFDWRRAVGPDSKQNGWLFGVDEYLSLCRTVGATPLITISDFALSADQMPENAAELVEYLNSPADNNHPWANMRKLWGHSEPYNVKWFELGNESMHGNHRVVPHRQFTAEEYAAYAIATAAAMRKVDPRIKLGIITMPGPGTDVNCDWNRTVIRLAGGIADFVVIHMYAPQVPKTGVSEPLLMQSMMVAPQHVEMRLQEYHLMIKELLRHDLPLAITEFNGAVSESASPYRLSFGDALECADLLRVFLKPESNVALASYWDFINGPFGMLRTNLKASNGEPVTETPALMIYKLWTQHFGSQLVKVEVQSPLANFPGAGSEEANEGDAPEARRMIQTYDLNQYSSQFGALWSRLLNVQIQRKNSDFTIHLDKLSRSIYPGLASLPRPAINSGVPVDFTVSFDAKFTPDSGSEMAPMGIGLMDSRGWNQTHSGIGVDSIAKQWNHFEATYRLAAETPTVDLTARLMADGKTVSGTLQIHNLQVTSYVAAHDSAYSLLTSSASISSDGKNVYLIVINKSANESNSATIALRGFSPSSADYWEINGQGLSSTSAVSVAQHAEPLSLGNLPTGKHVFPAHSITAIEFGAAR